MVVVEPQRRGKPAIVTLTDYSSQGVQDVDVNVVVYVSTYATVGEPNEWRVDLATDQPTVLTTTVQLNQLGTFMVLAFAKPVNGSPPVIEFGNYSVTDTGVTREPKD